MASYFSVVRFVPDAVADEAVNVALLVASGDRIEVKSLNVWDRVRSFAGARWAREARRLVEELQEDPKAFLGIEQVEGADALRAVLSRWTRALQFSDVRGSLDTIEDLMVYLEPAVLVGQRAEMMTYRNRRALVVHTIYRAMASAFELRFERRARGLLKAGARVAGQRTNHKLDVGVINGELYAGAFGLSFATPQADRQWKDTDAVAFAIEDLRGRLHADVPLCVVTEAPEPGNEASRRADALFGGMQIERVSVQNVDGWARRAIGHVPDALLEQH